MKIRDDLKAEIRDAADGKDGSNGITRGAIVAIAVAVVIALLWLSGDESQDPGLFRIVRQNGGVPQSTDKVVSDFFALKYSPAQRAQFYVTSSQPIAIFVLSTGVQIRTDSGWEPFSEELRNEIWRLKPGMAREIVVERPQIEAKQIWRAYFRYGTEMRGPLLWKWQLREAWQIRSFTNWTGRAWGGGRFGGNNEFFSEEFSK